MNATELLSVEKYNSYLEEVISLSMKNPSIESKEGERLWFLALAIEEYEKTRYVFEKPTAIEALKFRMEEMGLKQTDLIPYIGSKSKVSEVLSGKRTLSLNMVRALNKFLDIPADVLINEGTDSFQVKNSKLDLETLDLSKFPMAEVVKRKWRSKPGKSTEDKNKFIASYLMPLKHVGAAGVFFRKSKDGQLEGDLSLMAWGARVFELSKKQDVSEFRKERINEDFLKTIAQLSYLDNGPLLVQNYLNKSGIKFITLKHLTGTKLDGASFLDDSGYPIVALTLRHDRIDSFWFTLMHELAHVWKHLGNGINAILDEIKDDDRSEDAIEKEANKIAREIFIPRAVLKSSNALTYQTEESVLELADDLRIHPAIVAGRLRYELRDWKVFSDLIGQGQIKKLFEGCLV